MKKFLRIAFLASISPLAFSAGANAASTNYSIQNTLTGATSTVQASANNGAGVIFGDIDTGITSQWVGFTSAYNGMGVNNIDMTDSAVCLNGTCPVKNSSPVDQNGHGTFTASEIVGGVPASGLSGVAPAGKLIAVQVLSASGSGYSNDIANGITYAVNKGAEVLNLSLGPSGTAAQQTAFFQSIASAVNYAASKGAIIVFAGGNASQAFVAGGTITGYTDAAIQHMIFVGSTNSSEKISSFSNTPGSAYFVSTTGKKYNYDSMWVMADGENIWGASNYSTTQYGYGYVTQMSGTSMAAPQATGAAGLLAARWPFLIGKGTIPQIIFDTTQDLGTKGVDTTYGDGFLRIDSAMQPIGALTVTINGKTTTVSNSQLIVSGALGNGSNISNALQKAVAYDSFSRDFSVNLASSVASKGSTTATSTSTTQVSGTNSRSFAELGEGSWVATSFANAPVAGSVSAAPQSNMGLMQDPTRNAPYDWSVGFSEGNRYVGVGQGSNAALLFNDARWGEKTAFFNSDAAGAGTILGLVPGANFTSMGINTPSHSRLSVELIDKESNTQDEGYETGSNASAHGMAMGYTFHADKSVAVSLTGSVLKENNMLLGSVSNGALAFGSSSITESIGLGANWNMGDGYRLGFDTSYMTSSPTSNSASLISGTSRLSGTSFNLGLTKDDVTGDNDTLGLTLKKPLRVYSGTANLNVPTGTDANGNPVFQSQRVGIAPSGNETDFGVDYARPVGDESKLGFSLSYREDADNIAGQVDGAAMVKFGMTF